MERNIAPQACLGTGEDKMRTFRHIAIGQNAPNAVTVGIERDASGRVVVAVCWPSRGDVDAEARYDTVPEALDAAEVVVELHGFAEIVVTLQSDDLWRPEWGQLQPAIALSDAEAFALAKATEASRDA